MANQQDFRWLAPHEHTHSVAGPLQPLLHTFVAFAWYGRAPPKMIQAYVAEWPPKPATNESSVFIRSHMTNYLIHIIAPTSVVGSLFFGEASNCC